MVVNIHVLGVMSFAKESGEYRAEKLVVEVGDDSLAAATFGNPYSKTCSLCMKSTCNRLSNSSNQIINE